MCIQMTQATILNAKKGREVVDGEFQTACSNACSSDGFGMLIKEVKLRN
jgi:molybdopterin-containing oxidoreductase family iron-sulfur binding subunit